MNRRKFVALGSATLCMMPVIGVAAMNQAVLPLSKPDWLLKLIKLNDEQVKQMAALKVKDIKHPFYGGYYNGAEIANPHSTVSFIKEACCAISSPESLHYRSQPVLADLVLAIQSLLKMQHSDGSIDLLETNFHSPPDTAFMVKRLVPSYKLLKQSNTPGSEKSMGDLKNFLQRAGENLITGGIHTPNHRWVISAAMVKLHELWPDQRYVDRVNEWLGEHIDIDPDGQYSEKSTYGYSALVDRVLITISKGLNKPEILDAVRKNLQMMRYYIHPNGEVVTEASNRQDKGQVGTLENYYYACRYLSLLDKDGEMAAMCRLIEATAFNRLSAFLDYFLEDPFLWTALPASKPLPYNYVKAFPYSGLVRIRRGQWDATILSNNPAWITFHKGNAVLQGMRVAASFFGKGQFESATIEKKGNSWVLSGKLEGPYFQPYPKDSIPADGDITKMPRTNRQQSNIQYLEYTVTIADSVSGIKVEVDIKGTAGVPVSMELIFRKGGTFNGVQPLQDNGDIFLFSDKAGSYSMQGDTIHFGPGKLEHKGLQLRGALPHAGAPTVYLTGFTPFKHTIQIS